MFSRMAGPPNVPAMAGGKPKSESQDGPRLDKPKRSRKRGAKAPTLVDRVLAPYRWIMRWAIRIALIGLILVCAFVALFGFVNPPTTHTMWSEGRRLGAPVDQIWMDADRIAPVMFRSAVAAEDANFCLHWGFDVAAIQAAIEAGGARGASTISQQVVKNVFLWQERSWFRKALEAGLTPVMEAFWSKRRILEVYLNVAEFDEGVFGVQAAAVHYFGVDARDLTETQAARLAAVLPSPKTRSASKPSNFVQRRAASIRAGAETINADGRADCFKPD
jgi:monofunctional glycosyltransferase